MIYLSKNRIDATLGYIKSIQIFVSGESNLLPYEDLAVANTLSVNSQIAGTLGVIGHIRMAYDRVILIVDITSELLSSTLSS